MVVGRDNLLYVVLANQLMQGKGRSTGACASSTNNLKKERLALTKKHITAQQFQADSLKVDDLIVMSVKLWHLLLWKLKTERDHRNGNDTGNPKHKQATNGSFQSKCNKSSARFKDCRNVVAHWKHIGGLILSTSGKEGTSPKMESAGLRERVRDRVGQKGLSFARLLWYDSIWYDYDGLIHLLLRRVTANSLESGHKSDKSYVCRQGALHHHHHHLSCPCCHCYQEHQCMTRTTTAKPFWASSSAIPILQHHNTIQRKQIITLASFGLLLCPAPPGEKQSTVSI